MSDDVEDFARERALIEAKAEGRLLGAAMRDPSIMAELRNVGVDETLFVAPSLRHAFRGMQADFAQHGRCDATAVEGYLEIVLDQPEQAKAVVDFCLRSPGVRSVDDVALLLVQMRERVGRRRLGKFLSRTSRDVDAGMPLADMLAQARREIEDLSAMASRKSDGIDAVELANVGQALADGSLRYPTVPLSIPHVDEALHGGVRKGTLCLVIAGTGTGKTTYGIHIATCAADGGFGVLYICLEDPTQTTKAFSEMVTGHRFPLDRNDAAAWSDHALGQARMRAWSSFRMVQQKPLTAEGVIAKVRARKRTHKVDLVVVDYVQRLRRSTKHGNNDDVVHTSNTLLEGAEEEGVAMVLLSQVSADGRKRLAADPKARLGPEDSAGGVVFANDSASILMLERRNKMDRDEKKRNVATVDMGKNRDHGTTAAGFMRWNRETTRLTPCGKDGGPVVEIKPESERTAFDDDEADS